MAQQEFPQLPYKYGDGLRGAAIAQTRDGKDELITPVTLWERNRNTGLYLPPGMLADADVAKPRVEATLTGSKARISSEPVVGVRTVTSIATELHAGASRKVGRTLLMVRNLDPAVRVRVGPITVSDRTGFGIEPEAVLILAIDPGSDVPIYAVSEAGAVQVEVLEA